MPLNRIDWRGFMYAKMDLDIIKDCENILYIKILFKKS